VGDCLDAKSRPLCQPVHHKSGIVGNEDKVRRAAVIPVTYSRDNSPQAPFTPDKAPLPDSTGGSSGPLLGNPFLRRTFQVSCSIKTLMRRLLSIFLILLFWLGPLAALLPGSDESRLPPCCRRHGAHHCAMSMRMMAMVAEAASGGTLIVSAPVTCPYFPGFAPPSTSTLLALASAPQDLPAFLVQPHRPVAGRTAAPSSAIRAHAGRGPPDSIPS